jgi:hypothetical protein
VVLKKREERYMYERFMWKRYGKREKKQIKEKETIIKGSLKKCYGTINERRQEIVDCGFDVQKIEDHSNVDISFRELMQYLIRNK